MQPSDAAGPHRVQQPYAIETFGMFRNMLLTGDFTPKVRLDAAMAKHPTGVGAVADARGEVTIFDEKLIVSYGKETAHTDRATDPASLLAMGSAADWQNLTVDHDIAPAKIEAYFAEVARAHGVGPEKSFPFQMRGTLTSYVMHVNAEPTGGPHGMACRWRLRSNAKANRSMARSPGCTSQPT